MRNHTNRSSSGPSLDSLVAWIEKGKEGDLWVYTPSSTGTGFEGQRLTLREELREGSPVRREDLQPPCPNGIFTGFCWICP
jgi:hypothetical protein